MIDAEKALKKLIEGNRRFVENMVRHHHRMHERRMEVAKGQTPLAVIVGCSDSRVPPEIIFDQAIGDIFVVRTAGNVVDEVALGSIQYAVEHLHVRLVVVLGHKRCGAVDACVKGEDVRGKLKKVMDAIRPAVEKARDRGGDIIENTVKANIQFVMKRIRNSLSSIRGKKKIIGAYYDLDTGRVELL
jgi:carbonic anhydrase